MVVRRAAPAHLQRPDDGHALQQRAQRDAQAPLEHRILHSDLRTSSGAGGSPWSTRCAGQQGPSPPVAAGSEQPARSGPCPRTRQQAAPPSTAHTANPAPVRLQLRYHNQPHCCSPGQKRQPRPPLTVKSSRAFNLSSMKLGIQAWSRESG